MGVIMGLIAALLAPAWLWWCLLGLIVIGWALCLISFIPIGDAWLAKHGVRWAPLNTIFGVAVIFGIGWLYVQFR